MSYNPFNNGRDFNPIISVDGSRLVKCPTSYEWEKEDLSNATAGRSEDGVMHKNRIGFIRGLKLKWSYLTTEEMQSIMSAFSPEYVTVVFIDPITDPYFGYRRQEVFYTGNMTAAAYNGTKNLWTNLSFNLISRDPS